MILTTIKFQIMGNYEQLKQAVSDVIKTNGNQEITGAILQNALLTIISTVGANSTFAGIATPNTNPGIPDQNVFWIASLPGQYVNFSNQILDNEVYILKNNNGSWVKVDTGIANIYKVNGFKQKVFGLLEKSAEATQGSALQIFQNGYWAKGTVLKLSLNSDDAKISQIAFGAMYPTGEVLNVANPSMNQVSQYTLTDDCTRIRVYAGTVSKSGTAKMKIETKGVRNNEFISNYIFGSYYKRKDTVNDVGTFFQRGLSVNLRKGTNVKITFNGTAQIDYAVFALKYPNGEIQNLYKGGINREFNVVLEDDCTNIRYFIHNVVSAGNVEFIISSEPQINTVQINGGSMSILGDSYSTYGLWIPAGNSVWYGIDGEDGNNAQTNNVNSVTQTWWYKLCKKLGVSLMLNESYNGSTICNTGYSGGDASGYSFIHRMVDSMGQENALKPKPNIIVLFGGTNDSWANSPLGELKYSDWTDDDLKNVLPAICYMFYYVQKWNPGALILNVVNTGLKQEIVSGFQQATQYYGIENIVLSGFGEESGHPNIDGMDSICDQIYNYIKNL